MIVAAANVGCDGGVATGAHAADVTFHCNCAAIEGDDVGAVGDWEQPTAISNDKQHSARLTIASQHGTAALYRVTIQRACQMTVASRLPRFPVKMHSVGRSCESREDPDASVQYPARRMVISSLRRIVSKRRARTSRGQTTPALP